MSSFNEINLHCAVVTTSCTSTMRPPVFDSVNNTLFARLQYRSVCMHVLSTKCLLVIGILTGNVKKNVLSGYSFIFITKYR